MNQFNHDEGSRGYLDHPLRKKKPDYFHELRYLSENSLIFIAIDRLSLHWIRRFNKTCLFCHEDAQVYDLDFCDQREVWVLYACHRNFIPAMQLAHTLQRLGAAKVCAILANTDGIKEVVDV